MHLRVTVMQRLGNRLMLKTRVTARIVQKTVKEMERNQPILIMEVVQMRQVISAKTTNRKASIPQMKNLGNQSIGMKHE